MPGLNHLEYRVVVALGTWLCTLRRIQPSAELRSARGIVHDITATTESVRDAGTYAFTLWWRIVVTAAGAMLVFGFLFDSFFYTRSSWIAFAVVAVFVALVSGAIAEMTVIKIRLGFLATVGDAGAPAAHRARPKFYDFWIGVVVSIVLFVATFSSFAPLWQR